MYMLTGIKKFKFLDQLIDDIDVTEDYLLEYSKYDIEYYLIQKAHLQNLIKLYNREKFWFMETK